MTEPMRYARDVAGGMPLVQRLPGGGLIVASGYARARADGGGRALSVELLGRGLEKDILGRPAVMQDVVNVRWESPSLNAVRCNDARRSAAMAG